MSSQHRGSALASERQLGSGDSTRSAIVLMGSADGIGRSILSECLRSSPESGVWITYAHNADAAHRLRDDLGVGVVIRCDATDSTAVAALAREVNRAGHNIKTLLHAVVAPEAGHLIGGADRLIGALDVSAVSLLRAISAFEGLWANDASVVFMTSAGAQRALPGYGYVGVAKAAAEALVRYLAFELGRQGVRINAVGTAPIATAALQQISGDAAALVTSAMNKAALRPAPGPAEVADAIAFLTSPQARGITGQVLTVDGGLWLR